MKSEPREQRSVPSSSEREASAVGADDWGLFAALAARASVEAPGLAWVVGAVFDDEASGLQRAYEAYERELERAPREAA